MRYRFLLLLPFAGMIPACLAQATYDARILDHVGLKYPCEGGATPILKIRNEGSAAMSGCVVETWKNGLIVGTFDWQLAVPALTGETRQPALPAVANVLFGDELEFHIISVNTVPDENSEGNILAVDMDQAPALANGGDMDVEITLGADPGSVTWSVKNALNQIVASGGPYEDVGQTVTESIDLPPNDCYTFHAEDALRSSTSSSVKVIRSGNTLIHASDLSSQYSKGLTIGDGAPCTNTLDYTVSTDAFGSQNWWEIIVQGTEEVVCTGGPYTDQAQTLSSTCCLPDGCYALRVHDSGGDGIAGGGYVLRSDGRRLIDNTGNFSSGGLSAIQNNEGFCLPAGMDRLVFTSCDKLDWRASQYVVANANAAVTAQYGANNANSGYQLWFFDPNGGYSFRRFQSHNTANGLTPSATRACHFLVSSVMGLADQVLYNVRVRSRVSGVYAEWGSACRFMRDPLRAQCPLTKLMDIPGNAQFSCGATRTWGAGDHIAAKPAARLNNNNVQVSANKYQFRFHTSDGTFVTTRTSNNYLLPLNWAVAPLAPGTTYNVDVRASFDGGATWCTDLIAPALTNPWGDVCTLTISGGGSGELRSVGSAAIDMSTRMQLFPDPNAGEEVLLRLPENAGNGAWSISIFDLTGKCVYMTRATLVEGSYALWLRPGSTLNRGMYLVTATNGENVLTERMVVQP